jgi:DNA-binding XRE family transcriptional regulator
MMDMDKLTRKRLESAGWKVGGASEFLGLTDAEAAIVELKVGLANAVRDRRNRRKMTQEQLGRLLGSSQSRVAKMEAADPSVSIDLMVRSLLRMGASRRDVASYIAAPKRKRAA